MSYDWKNVKLIKLLHKDEVCKGKRYTSILLSVGGTLLIVFLFYFLYFYNRINTNYIVTDTGIDTAMIVSQTDSVNLSISKPFDQIYLPISLCNTDSVNIIISDGETTVNTLINVNQEAVSYIDFNDGGDYISNFWSNYDYYCMEGLNLNSKKLVSEYVISIACDNDNGVIFLGKQGEKVAYKISKNTNINYWVFFLVSLVLVLGTGVVSYALLNEVGVVSRYTMIAIILGIVYFILFPAPCTNDSEVHIIESYRRASNILGYSDWNNVDGIDYLTKYTYEDGYIIQNTLCNTERQFPSPDTKMYDEAVYASFIELSNEETMTGGHRSLSDVKTVEYFPYVVSLVFTRLFNINLRLGLGFAKLAGFLCYLFMVRFAIKLIPYGKEALALFSLTPMMMQSMVSISYDLFCIGGSFVAFAYVLKICTEKRQYTWKDVVLIFLLVLVLAPAKHGIYFVCFIFMFFFTNVFSQILKKSKPLVCLVLAFFLMGGLAILRIDTIKELVITENTVYYSVTDLIKNPIEMIRFIGVSIFMDVDMLVQGMFGGRMGWNEAIAPWVTVIAFMIIFFVACNYEEGKYERKEKKCSIVTVILFILAIYVIFLRVTKRTWLSVGGVQGRYFIPIIPLIICFMNNHKLKLNCKPNLLFNSLWFVSVIHILFLMTVYLRR